MAYKHDMIYINNLPSITEDKIYSIPSNICKSYYYPEEPKCTSVEELIKKAPRYYFSFLSRGAEKRTFIKNCCYFDSLENAKKASIIIQEMYSNNTKTKSVNIVK